MKINFKKLLAISLATLFAFSTGCSENPSDDSSTSTTTTTSAVETTTVDENSSQAPTEPSTGTSEITPALWKLTTESGKTVYFMGSMHALPNEAYPLPDVIMNAYNSSDALAVECDTVAYQDDLKAQIKLSKELMYTDGTTLKDHIGDELYNALVEKTKNLGIYNSMYDYFKPAMWQSLIESYYIESSDLSSDNGLDVYFMEKAKADEKEIIEVESVEFQMDMLINFSDTVQSLILESYITMSDDEYLESLNELYQMWAKGDVEGVSQEEEIDESEFTAEELEAYADYNKQMLTDRNVTMANKLIELSKGDQNVFYIVGLAHFGGEDGILKLLDNAGITYERIEY